MVGNNHDNRPRQDRQYREGLMTGLLIALANQVGQGWSTAIIIAALVLLGMSLRRGHDLSAEQPESMGFRPLVFAELGMSKLRFLFREVAEIS